MHDKITLMQLTTLFASQVSCEFFFFFRIWLTKFVNFLCCRERNVSDLINNRGSIGLGTGDWEERLGRGEGTGCSQMISLQGVELGFSKHVSLAVIRPS